MKRISFLRKMVVMLLCCTFLPVSSMAMKVGGVVLPESIPCGKKVLYLNGAGIRKKFFLSLYVAGLYLPHRTSSVQEILSPDTPVALRLCIVSRLISSHNMEKATREGFEKSTHGHLKGLEKRIDDFISVFKCEPIKRGDVFDLVYVPGKGVEAYKNGKMLKVIEGVDFKQALFGIWLSDNPVQKDLKEKLLGR